MKLSHVLSWAILSAFLSVMVLPHDAQARRLGGSRSFGRTAPSFSKKAAPTAPSTPAAPSKSTAGNAANSPPPVAPAPARNRFMGPLLGIAAGLGIGAMLSHFGMGEGMGNFVGLILLAVVAIWLIRKLVGGLAKPSAATQTQAAYSVPAQRQEPVTDFAPSKSPSTFGTGRPMSAIPTSVNEKTDIADGPLLKEMPENFDDVEFIASAKKFFVTMQGLFDSGDLTAMTEYATDDVIANVRADIESRAGKVNKTDVVMLNAELIGFEVDIDEQLATVAFSGMLREEVGAAAEDFNELWIFTRPVAGGGWLLAGIHNT